MTATPNGRAPTPGWFDDGSGQLRWWDGSQWQQYAPHTPPQQSVQAEYAGRKANEMPVIYTRQQKGHSLLLFICTDWITLYIRTIYYSVSPNHYWHL